MRISVPRMVAGILVLMCGGFVHAAERTIIVSQDGSGAFKSIGEAIASIKDATKENPVTVLIKPGTYSEMLKTKDWVNLVGEDREKCVITYTRKAEEEVSRTHVIWATSNSLIKDLTLVGRDVKYCIHSDGGGPYVLTVESCTLHRDVPEDRLKGFAPAFGIGLHSDQHIVMKDCLLDGSSGIYWHNWNQQRMPCSMTLEKCTLKGGDYAIGIYNLGSRQHDFFVLHDCTLTGVKGGIVYANQRNVKGTTWDGQDETELVGSGNTMGEISGAKMRDDAKERLSGLELCKAAEPRK